MPPLPPPQPPLSMVTTTTREEVGSYDRAADSTSPPRTSPATTHNNQAL